MKESSLKTFVREAYATRSPIPYIITIKVVVFILIHIFDLLYDMGAVKLPLYDKSVQWLSLPGNFIAFSSQPWSIFTYPLITTGLFNLLFSCLWLYWISRIFLNLLHTTQLTYLLISSLLLGGVLHLTLGSLGILGNSPFPSLRSIHMAIGALAVATAVSFPFVEMRLFLLGTIKFVYIAAVYVLLQFGFYLMVNKVAAVSFLIVCLYGWVYARSLQKGKDWSKLFERKSKRLKVVSTNFDVTNKESNSIPDQETIDRLLDKISTSGYNSLTKKEKDTLFKASQR